MSTRPSQEAQEAVYAALSKSADAESISTVTNVDLRLTTRLGPRTVEYALRALRETGRIEVAYARTRQRVIKVK